MLKTDKEETFFVLPIFSCPELWVGHTGENIMGKWQFVTWQWFWLRPLSSFCWKTTGKAGQQKCGVQGQKFHMTKHQPKRKGKQLGVNSLVVPWVQNDLGEDGQRRASYDSMNFTQKYKRIAKKEMQFMWKKGICCVVLTTQPEKEKLFMMIILLSRLTTWSATAQINF